MEESGWTQLDQLVADKGFDVPPALWIELAERLHEASEQRDPRILRGFADQLGKIVATLGRDVAPGLLATVSRIAADENDPRKLAFVLGHFNFAHQFAATNGAKRADVGFEDAVKSQVNAPYVQALLEEEMTGVELAERIGQRPETVSRNLKKLRELGIVEFRREGTSLINFLTQSALDVLDEAEVRVVRTKLAPRTRAWIKQEQGALSSIMREAQSFASRPDAAALKSKTLVEL